MAKKEGHQVKWMHAPTIFKDGLTREFKPLSRLFNIDDDLFEEVKAYNPDLIAFSVVTYHYQLALYYAESCKKVCPNVKIVFGGMHVSFVPEIVIAHDFIDYIVIGEGEPAFPEIIKHIGKGNSSEPIINTWYKSKDKQIIKGKQIGFIQNLDDLPQYDFSLLKELNSGKPFSYYPTMTSRGCPYNCSYCFNHYFRNIPEEKSNYIRRRSVKHVMEELKHAKEEFAIQTIEFWDDIFIYDKKWLKEFLDAYKKEIAVPFKCYIHVHLFDEDMAMWLNDAGCKWVDFGIQHINEEYRKKYLKRHETNANIVNALNLLRKYDIVSYADYIVGLPGDTIEHNEEARLFFLENMPDIIEPYWMSYHPKSEIIKRGFEHNILTDEIMDSIHQGFRHSYFENGLGAKDFHKEYYFIFKVLPSLPTFLRFKLTYEVSKKIPYFFKILLYAYSILYLYFKHKNIRVTVVLVNYPREMIRILKLKFFSKKK
jgi:radical SAM superfamily enzyme YgiQ (UPF0313 family)